MATTKLSKLIKDIDMDDLRKKAMLKIPTLYPNAEKMVEYKVWRKAEIEVIEPMINAPIGLLLKHIEEGFVNGKLKSISDTGASLYLGEVIGPILDTALKEAGFDMLVSNPLVNIKFNSGVNYATSIDDIDLTSLTVQALTACKDTSERLARRIATGINPEELDEFKGACLSGSDTKMRRLLKGNSALRKTFLGMNEHD